jgi:hypothetical protein
MLGRAPALVVLDRELDLVLAQDRLGPLDRFPVGLEAGLERLETIELFVFLKDELQRQLNDPRIAGRGDRPEGS